MKISREVVEVILVEHASRDEDPPGPYDNFPPRDLRSSERRHARIGPDVLGRDVEAAQLITRPPQLGLGQQPQVGLGPFVAHPPSLHRPGSQ